MSYRNGFLLAALALVTLLGALPLASRAQCGAESFTYRARFEAVGNVCGGESYAVTERVRTHRRLFGGLFHHHRHAAATAPATTTVAAGCYGAQYTEYTAPTPQAAPTFPAPQAPSKVLPAPTAPPKVAPAPQVVAPAPAPQAAVVRPIPAYDPLAWVNHARARLGLHSLAWDANLANAAAMNNVQCVNRRSMGHWHVVAAQCVSGTSDPGAAVRSWVASPAHAAILLSPTVRVAGIDHRGNYATLNVR